MTPDVDAVNPDVIVIGAGPAGLMAATCAARRGLAVVLLEKNRQPGLKILISGGGRCNLTTTRAGADLEAQFGTRRGRWLRHALRAFPAASLRAHVEALGVPLREEDLEKVFPVSGRAADILNALLADAASAGVRLVTNWAMQAVARTASGFVVATSGGNLAGKALVLATGGLSYPRTGATGDGYPVAQALGHSLVRPVPALAPLSVDEPWIHDLQGIVVDARLSLLDPAGRRVVERRRPTLFTHRGLSGPAPMDVSGFVEEAGGNCTLCIDLTPDLSHDEVDALLVEGARVHGRRLVQNLLPDGVPERLRVMLCERTDLADVVGAELPRDARRRLVDSIKDLRIKVDRSLGFKAAEVTRGGIPLEEIDPRTMESKACPGLHLCGEILDIDGPIGGFNFQAAFATGRLAGLHCGPRSTQ